MQSRLLLALTCASVIGCASDTDETMEDNVETSADALKTTQYGCTVAGTVNKGGSAVATFSRLPQPPSVRVTSIEWGSYTGSTVDLWFAQSNPQQTNWIRRGLATAGTVTVSANAVPNTRKPYLGMTVHTSSGSCTTYYHF